VHYYSTVYYAQVALNPRLLPWPQAPDLSLSKP